MANVQFFRGLKSKYVPGTTHKDGIYFATDTKELLVNNVKYGGGELKDVTYNTGTGILTIKKDSGDQTYDLKTLLKYTTSLPDSLTTPSKVGGLPAGTSVATLKTKTLNQIFDDILFEEIQPTVKAPSCSISPKDTWSSGGIYEVGAAAPQTANFNVSFDRGTCTVVGQSNKYRAGTETGRKIKLASSETLPAKVTLGTMTYTLELSHGAGETLLTSKGNKASVDPNPLPAGTITSTTSIYGTYPYMCNGATASTSSGDTNFPSAPVDESTKLPLQKWTDTLVGAKFASEASSGTRLSFLFPKTKNVTKVEFYNTVSGKWEVFGTDKYEIKSDGMRPVQDVQVNYMKLTTKGAMSGALQLRFTIANASKTIEDEPDTYEGEEITDEVFRRLAMNSVTVPFMALSTEESSPIPYASTGNRPAGVANFAVNFEPGGQAPLDARSLVPTKADLIATTTYSGKNYYKGMLVIVADDSGKPGLYVLKDTAKITSTDYSGWQKVDAGAATVVQIVNDLTTGGSTKALSAEQGKVLKGLVDAVKAYTVNGKRIDSNPVLSGADIKLTGYSKSTGTGSALNIAATDSTNIAIGKLEKKHEETLASSKSYTDQQISANVTSKLGKASGIATLDSSGKVPSSQLPSYVDDVLDLKDIVAAKANIPTSGLTVGWLYYARAEKKIFMATSETAVDAGTTPETGKIYVTIDDNKTYRWSGTDLVEISASLALGETSSTAYAGDKGKANRDAITSLPATLISEVSTVTPSSTTVSIAYKKATKSGLNYGSPASGSVSIPAATISVAGVMSAGDKVTLTKLNKQKIIRFGLDEADPAAEITKAISAEFSSVKTFVSLGQDPNESNLSVMFYGDNDGIIMNYGFGGLYYNSDIDRIYMHFSGLVSSDITTVSYEFGTDNEWTTVKLVKREINYPLQWNDVA